MPKRVVKHKLIPHTGMERFRLRTRAEIKRYINARITHARGIRKHGKVLLRSAREKKAYWHKPDSFMVVHKLVRSEIKLEAEGHLSQSSVAVYRRSDGNIGSAPFSKDPCCSLPTPKKG